MKHISGAKTFSDAVKHYDFLMDGLDLMKTRIGYAPNIFGSVFGDFLNYAESEVLNLVGVPDRTNVDINLETLYNIARKYDNDGLLKRVGDKWTEQSIPFTKRKWVFPFEKKFKE